MSEHSHGNTNGPGGEYSVQSSHFNQFGEPVRNSYGPAGGVSGSSISSRIPLGSAGQASSPSSGTTGYTPNLPRGMSGSGVQPPTGSTPTLNQLLQNPNANQRYPSSYGDFGMGQQKDFGGSHNYSSGHGWPMQQNPMNPYQSQMPGNQNFRNQVRLSIYLFG